MSLIARNRFTKYSSEKKRKEKIKKKIEEKKKIDYVI